MEKRANEHLRGRSREALGVRKTGFSLTPMKKENMRRTDGGKAGKLRVEKAKEEGKGG